VDRGCPCRGADVSAANGYKVDSGACAARSGWEARRGAFPAGPFEGTAAANASSVPGRCGTRATLPPRGRMNADHDAVYHGG
jgi:hypothetical protein